MKYLVTANLKNFGTTSQEIEAGTPEEAESIFRAKTPPKWHIYWVEIKTEEQRRDYLDSLPEADFDE
jgi:hypothetical protein